MSTDALIGPGHSCHIIGVGGAGMSAIAEVLAALGMEVSGSDQRDSPVLERLRSRGIRVGIGHDASNVESPEWVTASPAVGSANVERADVERRGIPLLTRREVLAALVAMRRTVAIAGTHGKTTTSTMATLIAEAAGAAPSFMVGESIAPFGTNARWGAGDLLIIEADESYGTFTTMVPAVLGITNIEVDHLDHYGTEANLIDAFTDLARRTTDEVVVFADDPLARAVGAAVGATMVGTAATDDVWVSDVRLDRLSSTFTLTPRAATPFTVTVAAAGAHNVANAAIAAAAARAAGIPDAAIVDGLGRFGGVPRRFEHRGTIDGVTFIDDYAHLPSEVAATVTAARAGGNERLVVVFQPHRYTRTSTVGEAFGPSFAGADCVIITDIYSAGEAPIRGVTAALVTDAVRSSGTVAEVHFADAAHLDEVVLAQAHHGTVVLTLGAGDLTDLPTRLIERLEGS